MNSLTVKWIRITEKEHQLVTMISYDGNDIETGEAPLSTNN